MGSLRSPCAEFFFEEPLSDDHDHMCSKSSVEAILVVVIVLLLLRSGASFQRTNRRAIWGEDVQDLKILNLMRTVQGY